MHISDFVLDLVIGGGVLTLFSFFPPLPSPPFLLFGSRLFFGFVSTGVDGEEGGEGDDAFLLLVFGGAFLDPLDLATLLRPTGVPPKVSEAWDV